MVTTAMIRMALTGMGLLCACAQVHAARPMITDDARIVDDKACQVESWARHDKGVGNEFWVQPACNFTGNLEVTVGAGATRTQGATHTTALVLQGKTLFKPLEANGWGWGLALGTVRNPRELGGASWYGYVPFSVSLADDRVVLHTNVGWQREQGDGRKHVTWGLGSETQLSQRSWLIAETFGQGDGKPFYQIGLRHWVVPERVQVDATAGNRMGGGEQWVSIGLRWLSPAFLP